MLEGDIFKWWYKFFVAQNPTGCIQESIDTYRKQLVYLSYMSMLTETIVLMCPYPDVWDITNDLSPEYETFLNSELKKMDWRNLFSQTIEALETEGDKFFQICLDESRNEFYLLPLDTINMEAIYLDENNRYPEYYVYKRLRTLVTFDEETSYFNKRNVTDKFVFTKGGYIYYDGENYPNKSKGVYYKNPEIMGEDVIPIVRVKALSEKKDHSGFSNIPAISYLDAMFVLVTTDTDRRLINRLVGYPRTFLIDGVIDVENSSLDAGGVISVKTDESANEGRFDSKIIQAQVKHLEITNGMSSLNTERNDILDILYSIVGVMRPRLEERMGASDSSKAIAQFRIKQEAKNRKYLENVIESFSYFFGLLLRHNYGLDNLDYEKVYLEVPNIVVNSSIFDELTLETQKISIGMSSIANELRRQGLTPDQIDAHMEEINKEVFQAQGKEVSYLDSPNQTTETTSQKIQEE